MIDTDYYEPPSSWLTTEQRERWQALKEELHDIYRQERELLLASYADRPGDHRPAELNDSQEKFIRELAGELTTRAEKKGLLLLERDGLARLGQLQERAFSVVRQRFELSKEIIAS
jgi:hypothetical protein